MEEKLLKIFKMADSLNEKQDKVFAQIIYTADNNKTIEALIKAKKDHSCIERCQFNLCKESLKRLDDFIELFKKYTEDITNK